MRRAMYVFEDPSSMLALYEETWQALTGDVRHKAYAEPEVLPPPRTPHYGFRVRYGWLETEVKHISGALNAAAKELRTYARGTAYFNAAVNAARAADRYAKLADRWELLLTAVS